MVKEDCHQNATNYNRSKEKKNYTQLHQKNKKKKLFPLYKFQYLNFIFESHVHIIPLYQKRIKRIFKSHFNKVLIFCFVDDWKLHIFWLILSFSFCEAYEAFLL